MASSSLLSAAVPLEPKPNQVPASLSSGETDNKSANSHQASFQQHAINDSAANATTTTTTTTSTTPVAPSTTTTTTKTTTATTNSSAGSEQHHAKEEAPTTNSSKGQDQAKVNTQPIVPPLIIPLPQPPPTQFSSPHSTTKSATILPQTAASSSSKSTAKTKIEGTPTKTTTRKKSTESNNINNDNPPKPESKPKASRSKKATTNPLNNNSTTVANHTEEPPPKPEPKSRGKSRASANNKQPANNASATTASSTTAPNSNQLANKNQAPTSSPNKRKSRSASVESSSTASTSPVKRSRKKKTEPQQTNDQQPQHHQQSASLNVTSSQNNSPQFLSSATSYNLNVAPVGTSPLMINTPIPNSRLLQGVNSIELQDCSKNRYYSPMISPYASYNDHNMNNTAPSLSRASLSRLFTSSSASDNSQQTMGSPADDPARAFEELRENTWSHLSKCVLEQAQQFEIPSLIGTLYTLRNENEKLVNRVRDLTLKRDQLLAMNARLDLPGPMLTQHLNNTSPNFSSVVSGLTNSPKSLSASSPGSVAIGNNKQPPPPLVSIGQQHIPPNTIGPHVPPYGLGDRSSPMIGVGGGGQQAHSGLNNIKTSSMSTPSPPIGVMMAHSTSNRAGLITVNPPYNLPNVFPPKNTLLGTNPQTSSYYPRQ